MAKLTHTWLVRLVLIPSRSSGQQQPPPPRHETAQERARERDTETPRGRSPTNRVDCGAELYAMLWLPLLPLLPLLALCFRLTHSSPGVQYLSDCRRHCRCRCRRRCRCRHRSVLVPGSLRGITNNYSNTDCDCDCDAAEKASAEVDSKSVSQYIHKQKALGTGSRK